MSFKNLRAIGAGLLAVLLSPAQAQDLAQNGITITGGVARLHVAGPRPLAEALYQLSRVFKWRIGFEEAALVYSGDLVDMTSPKYVPKSPDDRAYFPRGGSLDLQFPVSPETRQVRDPAAVIEALLTEYHARGYPAKYTIGTADASWFYVVPDRVADRGGVLGKAEPMTKARVSVVIRQDEDLNTVVQEVLKELSGVSRKRVGLGAAAANQFFRPASPKLTSSGESASTFLDGIALTLGANFWQLLYAPDLKLYLLSFPELSQPE